MSTFSFSKFCALMIKAAFAMIYFFRFNPITLRFEPYREPSIFKTITAVSVVIITVSEKSET